MSSGSASRAAVVGAPPAGVAKGTLETRGTAVGRLIAGKSPGALGAPEGFPAPAPVTPAHVPVTGDAPTLASAADTSSSSSDGSGCSPGGRSACPSPVMYVSH